jgi:hypothetical protein
LLLSTFIAKFDKGFFWRVMTRCRRIVLSSSALLAFILLLCACTGAQTQVAIQASSTPLPVPATPSITSTPDLCAANNIRKEVKKVYDLMHKFDDTVFLASLTPQQQLPQIILILQDTRRQTEMLDIAVCVGTLRLAAVNYQNETIIYLAHFMGGSDRDQINTEMADSQNLRKIYDIELSRLLGVPYVPPPTSTPLPTKATDQPTPTETVVTPGGAPGDMFVTNNGGIPANLRDRPSVEGAKIGELPVGERAKVLARTPIGDWLLVEFNGVPNNLAWVFTNVVTLNVDIFRVPVIAPAPTATPTS